MSPPSSLSFMPFWDGPDSRSVPIPIAGLSPCGLLVVLLVLPLLGAVLSRWVTRRRPQRMAAVALFSTASVAAYLLLGRLGVGGAADDAVSELGQPLWRVLSINRLQLDVGLILDRGGAGLLGLWALLAGWTAFYAERRRAAWLSIAGAALGLALLGDGLWTRLVGWEGLTLAGWALSIRRGTATLWLGRSGDATLLLAAALLFWALGGSWSSSRLDSRYELDAPPTASVSGLTRPAEQLGPTLALHELPTELHPCAATGSQVAAARAALGNKLWLGGRLLGWLFALFTLAVALKVAASSVQLLAEWHVAAATSLLLWAAAVFSGWHLLWRLR